MKNFYFVLLFAVLGFMARPISAQNHKAVENHFSEYGEMYFRFSIENQGELEEITKIISIDAVNGLDVTAYANQKEMMAFLEKDIDFEILPAPGLSIQNPNMKSKIDIKAPNAWDYYPTYEGYLDIMNQFAQNYPNLCEIVEAGESDQGRKILFARISDNVGVAEDEPEFMYTATMHGDETAGYVLSLRLIDYLLSNYGSNERITNMVNEMDIFINPLANPDGTFHGGNNTVMGATRTNANNVDINRNFPDPDDGPHPDGNPWQAETLVMMDFAEERNLVMSANWHGGAELANYPWDTWSYLCSDDAWWFYVCTEYADTAHYHSPNGYFMGEGNGVTNGYAWYPTTGCRQDYMNYYQQCREFTLEITDQKLVPTDELDAYWEYSYRSFLNYMEQALYGFRGIVTAAHTGEPLYAEVRIPDHDADSSWVYTQMPVGNYHRPIFAGTYTLQYSAPGYITQTITNSVENYNTKTINVALQPNLSVDFDVSNDYLMTGTSVNFMDLSVGDPISWEWEFEGGTPASSTDRNPQNISYNEAGNFKVKLTVTNEYHTIVEEKEAYITVGAPFPDFSADPLVVHVGDEIQFTDLSLQNPTEWLWTFGDWNNSTEQNPVHAYTAAGVYAISLKTANQYGEKTLIRQGYITVTSLPEADFESDIQIVATDQPINFTDLSTGGPTSWQWTFDGGTPSGSTDRNPQGIIYSNPGSYNVSLIVENEHGSNTIEKEAYISVGLRPEALFSSDAQQIIEGQSVLFTDESTNNPQSWEWYFEGGEPQSANVQNPENIFYNNSGLYTVTLKVSNEFGSDSLIMEDFINVGGVGVDEEYFSNFSISPNPAKEQLTIEMSIETSIQQITINDERGKEMMRLNTQAMAGKNIIDIHNLPKGLYFIRVHCSGKIYVQKFIKL